MPGSAEPKLGTPRVDFRVDPTRYRHWRLVFDGPVATLTMDVDEYSGLVPGCELKLSSYDLGVEIEFYLKRTLKRLDVTSRSLIALIEPGSCFVGSLLELALAADWSFQLSGVFERTDPDAEPAAATVGEMKLGPLPMGSGLTRLERRYLGNDAGLAEVEKRAGDALEAEDAEQLGLVTFTPPATLTGANRYASPWRSVPASAPTPSPASRRTTASPARSGPR